MARSLVVVASLLFIVSVAIPLSIFWRQEVLCETASVEFQNLGFEYSADRSQRRVFFYAGARGARISASQVPHAEFLRGLHTLECYGFDMDLDVWHRLQDSSIKLLVVPRGFDKSKIDNNRFETVEVVFDERTGRPVDH